VTALPSACYPLNFVLICATALRKLRFWSEGTVDSKGFPLFSTP
jgi:hypothetical protein